MEENKYWNSDGSCKNCGHAVELHLPSDLRDHAHGVRCAFDRNGNLLPHIREWLRPIVGEAARKRNFRKEDSNISFTETHVLKQKELEFKQQLSACEAEWAAKVAGLQEMLSGTHAEWESYMKSVMDDHDNLHRKQMSAQEKRIREMEAELGKIRDSHAQELAELCRVHDKALEEQQNRFDADLERIIVSQEGERRKPTPPEKLTVPPPPPVPARAKPIARVAVREITQDIVEKHRPTLGKHKLPGIGSSPQLKIVTNDRK